MQPAGKERPAGCNFYSQATAGSSVQTLTMFCFELPAFFMITYLIAFHIVVTIMKRKRFAFQLKCNVKNFRCILTVAMFTDRIEITSPGGCLPI